VPAPDRDLTVVAGCVLVAAAIALAVLALVTASAPTDVWPAGRVVTLSTSAVEDTRATTRSR
jgi:hypothetical protein